MTKCGRHVLMWGFNERSGWVDKDLSLSPWRLEWILAFQNLMSDVEGLYFLV